MDMLHLPGKGTGSRRVPLLLPPDVIPAMDSLIEHRSHCGVLQDNVYFFAVPMSDVGHVNEWKVMSNVASSAGLARPDLVRSTRLRKYTATVMQVISMKFWLHFLPLYCIGGSLA